tara:strand:- start:391 stop:567 length:177 start_codon:yes stop_codon:yes gene_type:complete
MQFKDVIIGAEDLECQTIDTVAQAISEHIIELDYATPETLTGFTWRLDVRMRIDNDDT